MSLLMPFAFLILFVIIVVVVVVVDITASYRVVAFSVAVYKMGNR